METLEDQLSRLAEERGFSGAIRVDRDGEVVLERAYGLAERGLEVPNTVDTRFALASATKGLTALTLVSLVREGLLALDTTARSVLGRDLPEIDDRVTIEHLLAHRSGIGDYLDEDAGFDVADYLMPVPVQELASTEGYLRVLEGYPAKFLPGERFA
ncbi:MAG TPA: serine hydrolase domain-containing protein, partial [Nocardioidaceae bacterium]|nr:serine hydrolase domain-containing protein [Nocardioidaceae bacterium]